MRLGALLGPVTEPGDPRALAEQARQLEAEGYDSLWSAHAVGRGFLLHDPFVTLATAAAVTERTELGTAVVQVPLYAPGDLAHRVLSLAQVCGSRLRLGVGAGSTAHDFAAAGREYAARFGAFRDGTASLRAQLAGTADENADGFALGASAEITRPQLLLGTWGNGVDTAARDYDGWIASAHYRTPDEVVAAHERYRSAGGGRSIVSTIQLPAGTDLGELGDRLRRFAEAGFDDAVVMFLPGGPTPEQVRSLLH